MRSEPTPEDIRRGAEAAASARFQPADETDHVCPACYHPPHWGGICAFCLCFKVHARGDDPQGVEEAVDEPAPPRPKHRGGRRRITRSVVLSRLKMVRWGR